MDGVACLDIRGTERTASETKPPGIRRVLEIAGCNSSMKMGEGRESGCEAHSRVNDR
jgi:hypothetical protein